MPRRQDLTDDASELRAALAASAAEVALLRSERDELRHHVDTLRSVSSELTERVARAEGQSLTLIAMVSHELRSPLHAISMNLDLCRRLTSGDGARDGGIAPKLERMAKSARRLDQLIHLLLGASQLAHGNLRLSPQVLDLEAVVRDVADGLAEDLAWAGCSCQVATTPQVGCWDRLHMELVVANLLSNAIKYGAGRPVTVRLEGDDAHAILTVQDRGIGIAEPDQPRIFERFTRLASASEVGGFGLGLWIVRAAVEAHGGTVRVQSALGRGATFEVRLPRRT